MKYHNFAVSFVDEKIRNKTLGILTTINKGEIPHTIAGIALVNRDKRN